LPTESEPIPRPLIKQPPSGLENCKTSGTRQSAVSGHALRNDRALCQALDPAKEK